jgi:hypothetical protein
VKDPCKNSVRRKSTVGEWKRSHEGPSKSKRWHREMGERSLQELRETQVDSR